RPRSRPCTACAGRGAMGAACCGPGHDFDAHSAMRSGTVRRITGTRGETSFTAPTSPDPSPMPATTPQRQQAPAASNLARTARLGGAVLCALVVLLLGAMLWSSHAHEFRHGSASVDNLARAVEQQLWLGLRDAEDDL